MLPRPLCDVPDLSAEVNVSKRCRPVVAGSPRCQSISVTASKCGNPYHIIVTRSTCCRGSPHEAREDLSRETGALGKLKWSSHKTSQEHAPFPAVYIQLLNTARYQLTSARCSHRMMYVRRLQSWIHLLHATKKATNSAERDAPLSSCICKV